MKARIYKPTSSAMQSAGGKDNWVLEFIKKTDGVFLEDVMGRTSSSDMLNEVKMSFPSKEAAVKFAESQGYLIEIIQPKFKKTIKKSYADNFTN